MFGLGTKLTRMLVIGALSVTSLVVTAPLAQSATVLEGPGHALASSLLFNTGSTTLKPSIETRLQSLLDQAPAKPWDIYITVSTSEAVTTGRAHTVAQTRVDAVAQYLKSHIEAAGGKVYVNTVIWHQPGLVPHFVGKLRYVFADLNW